MKRPTRTRWRTVRTLLVTWLLLGGVGLASGAPAAVSIELSSENGHTDPKGRWIVDVMEGDYAWLNVEIRDARKRPLKGVRPQVTLAGSSRLDLQDGGSDESGTYIVGVMAARMGEERLTVSHGGVSREATLNIISRKAAGFEGFDAIDGVVPWKTLQKTNVTFTVTGATLAKFPAPVSTLNGTRVRLIGFMVPLESEEKQKHFLLTSTPPSCYFHVPGGPAGAVEVFAPAGIRISWDPILLEGTLETLTKSDVGVVYRLTGATQKAVRKRQEISE